MITEAWRKMSRKERKPFHQLAKEDAARYAREMDEFTLSTTTSAVRPMQ